MASFDERRVRVGVAHRDAHGLVPPIRERSEVRVQRAPEIGHDLG
jgi:hypothetical protein